MGLFMPSEIARLVLGYLKETGCNETKSIYMKESHHLSEYVSCLKQGYEYPTTIGGKSLVDLLCELCLLRSTAKTDQSSTEIKQLLIRIEEGVTELKLFVANGHMRSANQTQKTANGIHNVGSKRDQENCETTESFISRAALNSASPVTSNRTVIPSVRIELPSTSSEVNVSTPNSSSSAVPTAVFCSSLCTPTSRPPQIYSSPSSIARSALIFSFGIDALQTPIKDKCLAEDGSWKSPRRKSQLPRKRLSYSPSPSAKKKRNSKYVPVVAPEDTETEQPNCDDSVDVSVLIGQLLNNTALHERIAANINRVVSNSNQPECSRSNSECVSNLVEDVDRSAQCSDPRVSPPPSESHMMDSIVKDIVDRTESDPLFEAFINIFFDKNEMVDVESPSQSPDTHGTPHSQFVELATPLSGSDSSPCSIADKLVTDSVVTKMSQNTPLASRLPTNQIFSVREQSNFSDKRGSDDLASPFNVSQVKSVPVEPSLNVENLPRLNFSAATPPKTRATSDLLQRIIASDLQLDSEVVQVHLNKDNEEVEPHLNKDSEEGITPTTVTYTIVSQPTVGSGEKVPTTLNNETTIFLQPQELGSSLQNLFLDPTLPPFAATHNVQLLTLSPGQLLSLDSSHVPRVNKGRTMDDFQKVMGKEEKKRSTLRPLRSNQRFRSGNKCRDGDRTLQIEPKRKQRVKPAEKSYNAVPLKFSNAKQSVTTRKSASKGKSEQEASDGTNSRSKTREPKKQMDRSPKLVSLLCSARTFKTSEANWNRTNHVRVLNFTSPSKSAAKSNTSDEAESKSRTETQVSVSRVNKSAQETTKSPLKHRNCEKIREAKFKGTNTPRKKTSSAARKSTKRNVCNKVDKRRDRKDSTGSVLTDMDVDQFLSRLRYVE